MSLTCGIVGLPNVGKSTLFNAITHSNVEAANYPFATINPNTGIVEVPDERLDFLCKLFNPLRKVAAVVEFTDIAGLVKGASKGEGLGNQFLANIRDTDAICQVVRCFKKSDILHVDGSVDAIRDVNTINLELILADLETIENRLSKIEKKAKTTKEADTVFEYELLCLLKDTLMQEKPIRSLSLSENQNKLLRGFHLLTAKPMIYVANMGEDDLLDFEANEQYLKLKEFAIKENSNVVPLCAKVEADLLELADEEKALFMEELGLKESGLNNLIKMAYKTLNLETFLTCGHDECRAWTFKKGLKAPQCAGIIHTDFEKGFIKAEVYSYADLVKYGSEQAIKENGKYRIEGKDYIMQDGDIVFFKFNR